MRALRIGISRNSKPKFTLLNGKFHIYYPIMIINLAYD